MKKLFLFIVFFIIVFSSQKLVWAEESFQNSTPSANIEVNSVANVIDRLKEKITLFLKFSSQDKANYYSDLVEKRLAELEYIVDSGQGDRIEETSSRYSTYLGKYSDFIIDSKVNKKKDKLLIMYERHIKVLDRLERNFEFNSGLWKLIEYDMDTVRIFTEKIKNFR